jgi:uncharacterized protein YacL
MWLVFFRLFVILVLISTGLAYPPIHGNPMAGIAFGAVAAAAIILLEMKVRAVEGSHMVGALIGGVTGLAGARLVWGGLEGVQPSAHFLRLFLIVALIYLGIVIGASKGEWFEPARIVASFRDSSRLHQYKILDTSVIIDGRIADICATGFLEGTLVVPQFVLRELQQVADSSDSLKRNRGRRGLDILQKVQKMANVHVQIVEHDFPEVKEVDLKLIELARQITGKIVTNDFNLNKVAQLRGVQVLNINELANSLKPVVLPGEVMRVFILKEGKEQGQGVGYLDDGTMVVVDQAKKALGKTIEVSVTSVLQTTAGKMIFCRWSESSAPPIEDNGRPSRPPIHSAVPTHDRRDARGNGGRDFRGVDRRDARGDARNGEGFLGDASRPRSGSEADRAHAHDERWAQAERAAAAPPAGGAETRPAEHPDGTVPPADAGDRPTPKAG